MMASRCRPATVADATRIAEAHVRSWQAAYDGLLPADLLTSLSIERRAEYWATAISRGDDVVVVEDGWAVLGFAATGPCRDPDAAGRGELYAIYLLPASWDRGAGHTLHEMAIDRLSAAGYSDATLWVLESNDRARRFYERHGWATDGTAKDDVRDDVTLREVRYVRAVSAG